MVKLIMQVTDQASFIIGILSIFAFVIVAYVSLKKEKFIFTRKVWAAIPVPILLVGGMYKMSGGLLECFGTEGTVFIFVCLLSAMAWYSSSIIKLLNKDRSLDNKSIEETMTPGIIIFGIFGWMIGGVIWGVWFARLICTMASFVPYVFAMQAVDKERCDKCRAADSVRLVYTEDRGTKSETKERHDSYVTFRYHYYNCYYRCSKCGYEFSKIRVDSEGYTTTYKKLPKRPVEPVKKENISPDQHLGKGCATCCYLREHVEDYGFHQCVRFVNPRPCQYFHYQKICPNYLV